MTSNQPAAANRRKNQLSLSGTLLPHTIKTLFIRLAKYIKTYIIFW